MELGSRLGVTGDGIRLGELLVHPPYPQRYAYSCLEVNFRS